MNAAHERSTDFNEVLKLLSQDNLFRPDARKAEQMIASAVSAATRSDSCISPVGMVGVSLGDSSAAVLCEEIAAKPSPICNAGRQGSHKDLLLAGNWLDGYFGPHLPSPGSGRLISHLGSPRIEDATIYRQPTYGRRPPIPINSLKFPAKTRRSLRRPEPRVNGRRRACRFDLLYYAGIVLMRLAVQPFSRRERRISLGTGRKFRLTQATIALDLIEGRRRITSLRPGSVLTLLTGFIDGDTMIDVLCEGREMSMFAIDLTMRGAEIKERTAVA